MLEIQQSIFDRLDLGDKIDLTESLAPEARSYQVTDRSSHRSANDLVFKIFEKNTGKPGQAGGIWDTRRWSTRDVDQWATMAHSGKGGESQEPVVDNSTQVQNIQTNWLIGELSQHRFFPRIIEVGEIEGMSYLLRQRMPQNLTGMALTRVIPSGAMLYQIISGIWTALCFLHQPEVNLPHGNLKLQNVLLGAGPVHEADIFLCDAVETSETARKQLKQEDFRALGVILYQVATASPTAISTIDALVRADAADWSTFGKEAQAWRQLCVRLLEEGSYTSFNALAAREEWLAPVRPRKTQLISIPAPAPANPSGPAVGGQAKPKAIDEICLEVDGAIAEGKIEVALSTATKALASRSEAAPELLSRIDYCAAQLPNGEPLSSELLILLEEAANLGSLPAITRLGTELLTVDPDEAYGWLESAVSRGDLAAIPHLARLYETGTPNHPPSPEKAVATMNKWREEHPDIGTDYLFAAMILRGKIGLPGSDAIRLLQSCHEQGHYQSTDLLAQCLATGISSAIDEKKAYTFFVEAWNRSKAASKPYFTASNNLGVCFASGFGVGKDMETAKHYFRQGALAKHAPSEENLNRLLQADSVGL